MLFGLIGKSLKHTFSPEIHKLLGIDYGVKELKDESEVRDFILKKDFSGINVTIPYKETVIRYLDFVSAEAKEIGAVNTIINDGGKLKGYNTDYNGMKYALYKAGIDVSGKNVLILGSGGTAKTASALCRGLKASKITSVSRYGEINYENVPDLRSDAEIIINCTPVGMYPYPDKSPIQPEKFKNLKGVFDAVYNPLTTELVRLARKLNIPGANGLYMLVAQACFAAALFTGSDSLADSDIERVFRTVLKSRENIVLTGMSSSGKTTVGKALASKLGRKFYDTDRMTQLYCGASPSVVINGCGEKAFRLLESGVIAELSNASGAVIALGGGAPLVSENSKRLKRNGFVVKLERDDRFADLSERPLTSSFEKYIALKKERDPIYNEFADITVVNNADIDTVTEEIVNEFKKNSRY